VVQQEEPRLEPVALDGAGGAAEQLGDLALRNVELTAPYGHDGAFTDLRAFIDHYSVSDAKLRAFTTDHLEALLQGTMLATADAILATRDTLLNGVVFPDVVVDEVTAFMLALTDPAARDLGHVVPERVPSGLPVDGR
jgi:cytochrome c peroxidase